MDQANKISKILLFLLSNKIYINKIILLHDMRLLYKFSFLQLHNWCHTTIGEGHFGKVVKAKMIIDEIKMTVAVKTLHSNPQRIDVENLMSELKIMIHLGKVFEIVTR